LSKLAGLSRARPVRKRRKWSRPGRLPVRIIGIDSQNQADMAEALATLAWHEIDLDPAPVPVLDMGDFAKIGQEAVEYLRNMEVK
jgi:hypothetical protein